MNRLFILDGTALIFRSFHAFSHGTPLTAHGKNVGMIYGFLLSLLKLIREEQPDYLAVTFDTGAPTFRHKMYSEYKANRPPLDEEIRLQMQPLYDIIDLMKIPQIALEGWEADDVMGTLAVRAELVNMEVFLVTGDKDFYQLVNDKIKVYTLPTRKNPSPIIYDIEGVKTKFGVYPHQITDALALIGDSSDNVPGVPSVGPVTAAKLIEEFDTLENILASAGQIKRKKLSENLLNNAEQARFSHKLVVIDTDAPVEYTPEQLTYGPINNADFRKQLLHLDFVNVIRQLDLTKPQSIVDAPIIESVPDQDLKYRTVTNEKELNQLMSVLLGSTVVSFDTETTGLDPMRAELVGLSFSITPKEAWYISVNHFTDVPATFSPTTSPLLHPDASIETQYILDRLNSFFTNAAITKTGQNLKYDLHVLLSYDINVMGDKFDTMIASYLLNPGGRQHNLDALSEANLGIIKIPTSDLIGSGSKQISMADVDLSEISDYACEDADVALRLTELFRPQIEHGGFKSIMEKIEIPLVNVLLQMEQTGIKIDVELLAEYSAKFAEEIGELEHDVYTLAGTEFNMNSTQQLANILFNELGLPTGKKTKTGFSTNVTELERLAPLHDMPKKLLRYRHLAKLKSTYVDALPRMVHPITGRVHTSYSQVVAITGRLSSNDPNLQNIPIRSTEGGQIRKAFVAGHPGWLLVSADYSQIELRVMAHLAGDEKLIQAFNEGVDIHRMTAAWMHDMPPELITSDMRRQAKEVNFGVLYGMGAFGLAQRLGITRKRAQEFITQYFEKFARVKEFITETIETARKNGFVETMAGRRRPLPDLSANNHISRMNAERIAINTPIQGSAADLMKIAMINVHDALQKENLKSKMLLQVHDELVFEAPPEELETLNNLVRTGMSAAMELKVPLDVDISWGNNWLEAHE